MEIFELHNKRHQNTLLVSTQDTKVQEEYHMQDSQKDKNMFNDEKI